MPGPLPRVDQAVAVDRLPLHLEGIAAVAQPFRAPLPGAAASATLYQQFAPPGAFPIGHIQAIDGGQRGRQAGGQVCTGRHHKVSSEPMIRLLTGVTMGPAMFIASLAFGT